MKTSTLAAIAIAILLAVSTGCSASEQTAPAKPTNSTPDIHSPSEVGSSQSAQAAPTPVVTEATTTSSAQIAPTPTVGTPTSTSSKNGPPPDVSSWTTFTDSSKSITFEIPVGWTAQERAGGRVNGKSIRVLDEIGMPVADLATQLNGFGGACGPGGMSPYSVLASVPMSLPSSRTDQYSISPRFVFRVISVAGKLYGSYGITDSIGGTDGTACMIYNLVSASSLNGYMFGDSPQIITTDYDGIPVKVFSSLGEAQAYVAGARFGQIQKMITSLRISF